MTMPIDLSRSLLTILVPGLIAVAPWLLALVEHTSARLSFSTYPTLAHALLFSVVVVVGSVFQGLGSILEYRWDQERGKTYDIDGDWYAYLASTEAVVGHRYLSRLVISLYFELAMLQAVLSFAIGGALLADLRFPHLTCGIWSASVVVGAVAAVYFYWQARCTHLALCKTRQKLRAEVGISGQASV
jgi:hypothetical protein